MALKLKDVRAWLEPEEPDYAEAAKLGPDALPHLEKLIASNEPGIASKAASLAGFIGHPDSAQVLIKAAQSNDPVLRVTAANAARYLPDQEASSVLLALVEDQDAGVQRVALQSLPAQPTAELQAAVAGLASKPGLSPMVAAALAATGVTVSAATLEAVEPAAPELREMPGFDVQTDNSFRELAEGQMPGFQNAMTAQTPAFDHETVFPLHQEMPGFD
jgi:hypothetical protein